MTKLAVYVPLHPWTAAERYECIAPLWAAGYHVALDGQEGGLWLLNEDAPDELLQGSTLDDCYADGVAQVLQRHEYTCLYLNEGGDSSEWSRRG